MKGYYCGKWTGEKIFWTYVRILLFGLAVFLFPLILGELGKIVAYTGIVLMNDLRGSFEFPIGS